MQITNILITVLAAASVSQASGFNPLNIIKSVIRGDSSARTTRAVLHPVIEECKGGSPKVVFSNGDKSATLTGLSPGCMAGVKKLQVTPPKGSKVISVSEKILGPSSIHLDNIPAVLLSELKSIGGK